ncbi:flippase [Patescibacteria group bacterium]
MTIYESNLKSSIKNLKSIMSLSHKIAKNTIIQILGKILSTILALFSIGLITRYLGPKGFGQYTIIIAFLSFFGILVDMGIYLTTLQMISEPGRDCQKIFSNGFTLRLTISVILLTLAPILALLFPYPDVVKKGIFVATFAFFFISLCQILHAIFQKELKMIEAEISEIIGKAIILGSIILATYYKLDLIFIMLCLVLGNFTHFIIKFIYSRKYIKIKLSFDKQIWKEIFFKSWPIALSIVFNLVYLRGDTIILSLFVSETQVGFYGASYKVLDVLTTLPIIFAGLMMPLFTVAWAEKNIGKLKKYLQTSFDIALMTSIPIILGTQFIATQVMTLVAGNEFMPSGKILKVLIIAVNMIFFGTIFGHFIVAINQQKLMLFGYLTTAILSLLGYLIFIPKFSYMGAAWVTVFSETLVSIIAITIIYQKTKISLNFKKCLKSLLSGILMVICLYFMRGANLFIIILAGIIVYLIAMFAIGGIDKEMMQTLKN